jgi:hypothetical protein
MNLLKHIALIAALAASVFVAQPQRADARTALVIGNADYTSGKLVNPTNDAADVADALRGAGFQVILKTNANRAAMRDAIREFGAALKTNGGAGLLYYAGHGVQSRGENYLLPVGELPTSESALRSHAVTASEAVEVMSAARNPLNIVILDACRNNPMSRTGATRGLSRMDSNSSLFVSFSTSPGSVALDGTGRNSPYSKHLKAALSTNDLTLEDTFKRTLKGVYQETGGQQQPWMSSSFFGDFVFRPGAGAGGVVPKEALEPQAQQANVGSLTRMAPAALGAPTLDLGGLYLVDGSNPDGSQYRGMATLTPVGDQYRFTWWIARQVFSGVGQFAGRMMVVNWGAKSPVIYSVARNNELHGEWADGSATDTLALVVRAPVGRGTAPRGLYTVAGRNPNGTEYAGRVAITPIGDRFRFDWQVGSASYFGTGSLDGNIMVVDWGGSSPAVYALGEDGILNGLWNGGLGEERLTPSR